MQAGLLMADSTIEGREIDLADRDPPLLRRPLPVFVALGCSIQRYIWNKRTSPSSSTNVGKQDSDELGINMLIESR
jgi:hypothetical protein